MLIFPHKIEKRADFDSFFPYNTRKEAVISSFFPLEDKEFFSTISRKESHGWLIVPCNREKEAMFVCFFSIQNREKSSGWLKSFLTNREQSLIEKPINHLPPPHD